MEPSCKERIKENTESTREMQFLSFFGALRLRQIGHRILSVRRIYRRSIHSIWMEFAMDIFRVFALDVFRWLFPFVFSTKYSVFSNYRHRQIAHLLFTYSVTVFFPLDSSCLIHSIDKRIV